MIARPSVQLVSRGALERYLLANGWAKVGSNSLSALYAKRRRKGMSLELIIPNDPEDASFDLVWHALSELEGKSVDQLINEIGLIPFDKVYSVIPNYLVRNKSISLDVAVEFVGTQRRIFAAAATVEDQPEKAFFKFSKKSREYTQKCRFAHTFESSFGFSFESPLNEIQTTIPGLEDAPPFERRVLQRLARGLMTLNESAQKKDVSPIIQSYETGLNANICEEFMSLHDATRGSTISMSFGWSPNLPVGQDLQALPVFKIEREKVEILQDASKALRQQEKAQSRAVYGLVYQLKAEGKPGDDLLQEREIVVRWISEERGALNVHVVLTREWYLAAINAHQEGRAVSVSGLLSKQGRFWVLSKPKDFVVLPF